MRTFTCSTIVMISCLVACTKQEVPLPSETKVSIGNEVFVPEVSTSRSIDRALILTFDGKDKKIVIRLNDSITGVYTVVPPLLKSAGTLSASITCTISDSVFTAQSGTVTITGNQAGKISGLYEASLLSGGGTALDINSGSFVDLPTEPLIATQEEIDEALNSCYAALTDYIEFQFMFDAVYSNQIDPPDGEWAEISDHSQASFPENGKILRLWSDAYQIIFKVNHILESSANVISDEQNRNQIIGQAKAIRAYLFYNLFTWFESIPLESGFSESLIPRDTLPVVLARIRGDALSAVTGLPATWQGPDNFRIPLLFPVGLIARISLNDFRLPYVWPQQVSYHDYNEAVNKAKEITDSGIYQLSADSADFSGTSTEMIWGFEIGGNNGFNDFFDKGSFVPVLRLTEIYLILSEALYRSGNSSEALHYLNILRVRRGSPAAGNITVQELLEQWKRELALEGSMFITHRRFEKAMAIVGNDPVKILLPIPFSVMQRNPNLWQNAGY
jgi:hypothetical protein